MRSEKKNQKVVGSDLLIKKIYRSAKLEINTKCTFLLKLTELMNKSFNLIKIRKEKLY